MDDSLSNSGTPQKLWQKCPSCERKVITCVDDQGGRVLVEWCIEGRGNVSITAGLLPGIEPVAVPSKASRYRVHQCRKLSAKQLRRFYGPGGVPRFDEEGNPRSFSAASFEGKRASKAGPNISYRPFDGLRRGRK